MKLNFDYYHNLEVPDMYLCTPAGEEMYVIPGVNRKVTLRFNDLSELSFDVYSTITDSAGKVSKLEAYDYIVSKRLIYVTNIGWFQISGVTENDDGKRKQKSVSAESLQAALKNRGFYAEERVYCFYNPNDPHDDKYDGSRLGDVPSVMGQLYQQLGIQQDLDQGKEDPSEPYDDWTITYINPRLIFQDGAGECRTLSKGTTFGYEFMSKTVENAFEVIVDFDYLNKSIKVMYPDEVAARSNVVYSFSNFMQSLTVTEDTSNLVTVLNCTGNNCDITVVNPMATNYLCDFSYYMDDRNGRWMSSELVAKLRSWQALADSKKEPYKNLVMQLRQKYMEKAQSSESLTHASVALKDLKAARDKKLEVGITDEDTGVIGIVTAEHVKTGEKSSDSTSGFYSTPFSADSVITCYETEPTFDGDTFSFEGEGITDTAENNYQRGYYYFDDAPDSDSYCKLQGAATPNVSDNTAEYHCAGFDRFIELGAVGAWIDIHESEVEELNSDISTIDGAIETINSALAAISNQCNILKYFADSPKLTKELTCYWIEGDYNNSNFAILDNTTVAEGIDIANELMDAGAAELTKVSSPRYKFSIQSIDATKQYEFRNQMSELGLGKVITVEKEDGVWYYPALLEMSFNLDNTDDFSLSFANALRLDDWTYKFADLVSTSAAVSRQVSANWQNITSYNNDKDSINELINNPLDPTLRAATVNMKNQEFVVDTTGILGRKRKSDSSKVFEREQVRLMNNVMIFTDDGWTTCKAALGKIKYANEDGEEVTAYGLIADAVVGSLIMGEKLIIKNADSSVVLGSAGQTVIDGGYIKTGTVDADQIASGAITADKIAANAITADKIAAGAITADKIDTTNLTASAISASDGNVYVGPNNGSNEILCVNTGMIFSVSNDGISMGTGTNELVMSTDSCGLVGKWGLSYGSFHTDDLAQFLSDLKNQVDSL